jgi:hypothetical protein
MSFLTIDGVQLKVSDFRRLPDEKGGGSLRRTLSGKLRGGPSWVARGWAAEVIALTDAEAASIYEKANGTTPRPCSGGLLPETVTAIVNITGDRYTFQPRNNNWDRVLSLNLRESL